jgi:hypothetical protein
MNHDTQKVLAQNTIALMACQDALRQIRGYLHVGLISNDAGRLVKMDQCLDVIRDVLKEAR